MKKLCIFFILVLISGCVFSKDFYVEKYGAKGDGKFDNTKIFQKVLDEAGKTSGTVYVDSGNFLFKGHINVPVGVTLQGTYKSTVSNAGIRDNGLPKPTDKGTCFLVTENEGKEEGDPFITLNNSSTLQGVVIYYPNQKPDKIPVPYPWCIAMRGNNPNILDCELLNPYNGIDATNNQRHLVRNITGQPLRRGIYSDCIYDIGRWENIHWNPWFSMSEPLWTWQLQNGEAFIIGRSDWHYLTNCFCYGYKIGYKFIEGPMGSGNCQLLGIGADGCNKSVVVESCNGIGLLFTNAELVAMVGEDPVMIEIGEKCTGTIMFQNSSFWGFPNANVVQKNGSLTLQNCHFCQWDYKNKGTAAINILGGNTIINGCRFEENKDVLNIVKATSVIFSDNMVMKEDSIKGKEKTKFAENSNIYKFK